jgi:hypothetical protein
LTAPAREMTPQEIEAAEAETRRFIWRAFGYRTHEPAVDAFHNSRARTKIVSCPARTAKSYSAWKDILPDILIHGAKAQQGLDPNAKTQIGWIVAPNYVLAKEFDYAWTDLVEKAASVGFKFKIERKINNVSQGDMTIIIDWCENPNTHERVKDIITVKSATNINVLQGEEVDWAILSEAARLPELVWTKFLSTRVKRSIWPTTPDNSARWIFQEIQRGKSNPALKIESFSFTTRANPGYQYERYWIEHQKAELRGGAVSGLIYPEDDLKGPSPDNGHDCFNALTECRAMKDDAFAEQFGGQWTFSRGRVVPIRRETGMRGEPSHVVPYTPRWCENADVHIAFDYGYEDYTVVGFWMVGPQQVFLRHSIYENHMTADDVVDRVKKIIAENKWEGRVKRMIGDPKKPEVVEVFRRRGLPIFEMDKKAQADRKAGHLELMNFLAVNPKTGEPYMMIHSDNHEIVEEFDALTYKEGVKDPSATGAMIGRDDGYDMTRYFVQSHPPISHHTKIVKLDDTDFAKTRRMIVRHQKTRRQTVPMGGASGLARAGM